MSKTKISGIYAIKNKINNKQYIGSSCDLQRRWYKDHVPSLNRKDHYNRHLQHAWNKYGEVAFEFSIIEECAEAELAEREGWWIENTLSWDRKHGYNLARIVQGRRVISEETRRLMKKRWEEANRIRYTTGIGKQILELYQVGLKKNTIAKRLNVCRGVVYSCLEYHGLHKNEGKGSIIKLTPEMRQDIKALREEGLTWGDILRETGVSKKQVYRTKTAGDGKYGGNKLKRNGYRTMTPEIREQAVKLRNEGKTWKEIGDMFGISRQQFYWHDMAKDQRHAVRKPVTSEAIEKAKQLKDQGLSWKKIGETLGYSESSFKRYINT